MFTVEIIPKVSFSFDKIVACNKSLHIQIEREARRTWQACPLQATKKTEGVKEMSDP